MAVHGVVELDDMFCNDMGSSEICRGVIGSSVRWVGEIWCGVVWCGVVWGGVV